MKAQLLIDRRTIVSAHAFVEMVLWRVPQRVPGSAHDYKYSLAYVVNDLCVLRYDNEAGKGDHRHCGGEESTIVFSGPVQLMAEFMKDVRRWNDENRNS
jgi:hypothetical protein